MWGITKKNNFEQHQVARFTALGIECSKLQCSCHYLYRVASWEVASVQWNFQRTTIVNTMYKISMESTKFQPFAYSSEEWKCTRLTCLANPCLLIISNGMQLRGKICNLKLFISLQQVIFLLIKIIKNSKYSASFCLPWYQHTRIWACEEKHYFRSHFKWRSIVVIHGK